MKRYLLLMLLPLALIACNGQSGNGTSDPQPTPAPTTPDNDASATTTADSTSSTQDDAMATPMTDDVPATNTASGDDAALALSTTALERYHWRLTDAKTAQGQKIDALFVRADKPVELNFKGERLNVSNTCNSMGSGYSIEGDQLKTMPMASTMMACPDEKLMALDREISARLQGTLTAALQAGVTPTLQLVTADGDVLTFSGEATAATRYGSEGETVFMEVGPETKPCSHPLIPDAQCLQVRLIEYDENGLKKGEPGEWENLYQEIEGYTHQNGVRNVLRLKRYKIDNPPADAPNMAYVLDMVVESELLQN